MQTVSTVRVDGTTLAYRDLGSGPPVLLLHGWPTSSFLWRDVMPPLAERNRVLALDLPGFGASDKPLDANYDFAFFGGCLGAFLAALEIDEVALAVHDMGGPVGVHWALQQPERVTRLALLNTVLYPQFSEAVLEFVRMLTTADSRARITSTQGLEETMRLGVADTTSLTPELLAGVTDPFGTEAAREALARAGVSLSASGFTAIERQLPGLRIPVRVIYGERDRFLPDVADTMARVKRDVPRASSPPCLAVATSCRRTLPTRSGNYWHSSSPTIEP